MSDYEMGLHIKRLKSIAAYAEKKNQRPTTMDLWESRDVKDYHSLRRSLAFMEKNGMILRHPEDDWRWSVTADGRLYLHAWRVD